MFTLFTRFFWLGCLGFGGPLAHIALFRRELVERRAWLTADQFAHTLTLCQFLPGLASSQLGFAIGLQRAGLPGAIAAFVGFTLPSFLLMTLLALGYRDLAEWPLVTGLWHGLKLFALVIVADALLTLFRQFCRNRQQQTICILVACLPGLFPGNLQQLLLTAVGLWSGWHNASDTQGSGGARLPTLSPAQTCPLASAAVCALAWPTFAPPGRVPPARIRASSSVTSIKLAVWYLVAAMWCSPCCNKELRPACPMSNSLVATPHNWCPVPCSVWPPI